MYMECIELEYVLYPRFAQLTVTLSSLCDSGSDTITLPPATSRLSSAIGAIHQPAPLVCSSSVGGAILARSRKPGTEKVLWITGQITKQLSQALCRHIQ